MGEYADMEFDRSFNEYIDELDNLDGDFEDADYLPAGIGLGGPSLHVGHPCLRPGCGGKMVERTNKMTGLKFLGCSNFPRCRFSA